MNEKCNLKSPKTPGGISKTLLTPIRRVGLSRKWRQSTTSPFISPLNGNNKSEIITEIQDKTPKKRKPLNNDESENEKLKNVETTPCRAISGTVKKSKTKHFLKNLSNDPSISIEDSHTIEGKDADFTGESMEPLYYTNDSTLDSKTCNLEENMNILNDMQNSVVSNDEEETNKNVSKLSRKNLSKKIHKKNSPSNLTNECIVVIERSLLKNNTNNLLKDVKNDMHVEDKPLNSVIKTNNKEITKENIYENEEHTKKGGNSSVKESKLKKLVDKNISTEDSKKYTEKSKALENIKKNTLISQISNSSIDSDDDDDFVNNRKTILLRKSYSKVAKPNRAKSTGSITQKDIEDLKAQIEMKKKILMAKTMSPDTQELKDLIKKWRKGCQDALEELMTLMKQKLPDKHNMDFSELLEMLKIPPNLVGYDIDHDCFKSLDDFDYLLNIN